MPKRWKRYAKRLALATFATLLVLIVTFPFWSLWVAKPVATKFAGVEIQNLDSLSTTRWQANGVSWSMDGVAITVEEVLFPSPTQLLLQALSFSNQKQSIVADKWILEISSSEKVEPSTAAPASIDEILQIVERSLNQTFTFLSSAELSEGMIILDGKEFLEIEKAEADPERVTANVSYLPQAQGATVTLADLQSESWTISAESQNHPISLGLTLNKHQESVDLSGNIIYASNKANVNASWPKSAPIALPRTATVTADSLQLDDRYNFWKDAPPLLLTVNADWNESTFRYRILGSTTINDTEDASIRLSGDGSLERLTVSEAEASLPWLEITSSQPIIFDFTKSDPVESAALVAQIDFSQLPFIEATGSATANLTTSNSESGNPRLSAAIQGDSISFYDATIDALDVSIEYENTVLSIKNLSAKTTHGSNVSVVGAYDFTQQSIQSANIEIELKNESNRLSDLLPQIEWDSLSASLKTNGPVNNLQFSGNMEAKSIQTSSTNPFDLKSAISGTLSDFSTHLEASIPSEKITATFQTVRKPESVEFTISAFELTQADSDKFVSLTEPLQVKIQLADTTVTLDTLSLEGSQNTLLHVNDLVISPTHIQGNLRARMIDPSLVKNWITPTIPPLFVEDVGANVDLSEQGLITSTQGLAKWSLAEDNSVDLSWSIHSESYEENAVKIEELKIGSNSKHILAATGIIPVSAKLTHFTPSYTFFDEQEFSLTLQSSPHPDFWNSIEPYFPVALTKPVARAELKGTLARPEGYLQLQLARLNWNHPDDPTKNLELTDIATSIIADSHSINIETLSAKAGSNYLDAHAIVPLKHFDILNLLESEQPFDLENISGQASLNLQDLNTLHGWLPPMLRKDGQAILNAEMEPGDLTAEVELINLATRPFPPLGALSKISGKLNFNNGVWKASKLTGLAEGSPFQFAGEIDMNDLDAPTYDLRFKSNEFPLVRDSGLLLSGDIDLALVSTNKSQTILKGKIDLTKGLFLVSPDLLAGSTKTVQSRPPYFSVEQQPFDSWDLDLKISGDKFLRVSNPFFEGILSADFSLEGTLGTPLLVGRAIADNGHIFFPASSLRMTRGQAFITREQSSVLQLDAAANGRSFAYDINLTVSGPIEDPELIITTTPALTQAEALLLLTTGTVPNSTNSDLAQNSATSLGIFIGTGLFRKLSGSTRDLASKLNLEVGQDVSLQGKPTIDATYQLTETLEVEGEYDKRDEFNANFKWTLFEK